MMLRPLGFILCGKNNTIIIFIASWTSHQSSDHLIENIENLCIVLPRASIGGGRVYIYIYIYIYKYIIYIYIYV